MLLPILLTGAYLITESKHVEMYGLASDSSTLFGIVEGFLRSGGWSKYVLLPYICANLGFWSTSIGSYIYTVTCGTSANLIQYGNLTRQSRMKKQSSKISFKVQLAEAIKITFVMFGLNTLIGKYFFQYLVASPDTMWPDAKTFFMQFTAMMVFYDFFLYWQHRSAHAFDTGYGWHSHQRHHEAQTPIAMNAAIIGFWDEVEAAGCVYLSAFVVQPHPVSYAFAVAGILSESASTHSGICDSAWCDFIELRFLPGRADVRMHDFHHMYSNNKGGRNFGQSLWIWDYAFGTLATIHPNGKNKVVHND
jgi:sterol desaturase/sphingolipid hydroxylase (fatty acid hydroxylase superfamily)